MTINTEQWRIAVGTNGKSVIFIGWVSKDDNALSIEGYSIIRADHPSNTNTKRGGVCIYYNDKISVRQMSNGNLPECLACETVTGKRKGYVIT